MRKTPKSEQTATTPAEMGNNPPKSKILEDYLVMMQVKHLVKERWGVEYDPFSETVEIPLSEKFHIVLNVAVTVIKGTRN
jgi:hypothetical protein